MSLIIKDLYFKYEENDNYLLDNINLNFNEGEIYLLYGNSGEGKSSFINLINGIIPFYKEGIFKGEILLDNQDIFKLKFNEISKLIGTVFQDVDTQIINDYIDDELSFGLENLNYDPSYIELKVKESCNKLGFKEDYLTKVLSGGEKERLIITSVTLLNRKVLILDEPLANLDQKNTDKILKYLKEKCVKEKLIILIIEHRLDFLLPYVNNIYKLENKNINKIEKEKLVNDIYNNQVYYHNKIINHESLNKKELIRLENISYKKNKKTILKNINLIINQNENILLLGFNGCGKTTLSKIIAKLIKPSSGKIYSTFKKGRKFYQDVSYLFQNPSHQLFMNTVEKELSLGSIDKEYENKLIKLFNLEKILNKHPYSLSQGEKRKIALLTMLLKECKLLILDEPSVGQDDSNLFKMLDIISERCKEKNITLIVITHDIRVMYKLSDKAVWIKDGSIYKEGNNKLIKEYLDSITNLSINNI
ncbi:MAG: ABC transporter ATP-binding protein [Bacillales bacterium]